MQRKYSPRSLVAGFVLLSVAAVLAAGQLYSAEPPIQRLQSGGVDRELLYTDLERLRELRPQAELSVRDLPGVIGFGIGRQGDQLVFNVLVDKNQPIPELPAQLQGIPIQITPREPISIQDGYPACGVGSACHANRLPLPVEMGNSASPSSQTGAGACTLGFKACDLGTGELVFVTNSHCNQNKHSCSLNAPGALWVHPGWQDTPSNSCISAGDCDVIGTVSGNAAPSCNSSNNLTDATKVASTVEQTSNAFRDIGWAQAFAGTPLPGDLVRRSSRTTGDVSGRIVAVDVSVDVPGPADGGFCCGALEMKQQIEWEMIDGGVTKGGDSGSALLSAEPGFDTQVVGLHWAGGGSVGYANHIDHVLDALNLSLNFVSCVQECLYTETEEMAREELGTDPSLLTLGHRFRDQVMDKTPEGREMIQMYYRISDEAMGIAARNPSLAWDTAKLLADMATNLEELVVRGETTLSYSELYRIDQLLDAYAERAGEDMRDIVQTIQRHLNDSDLQRRHGVTVESGKGR